MRPTVDEVLARRRADRERRLSHARNYADGLPDALGIIAVVVFGSVARGDFSEVSDLDVLVVAEAMPPDPVERQRAVGSPATGGLAAVVWTPDEFAEQHRRGNPVAVEAVDVGVVVRGSLDGLV